jgi:hypothetical protein
MDLRASGVIGAIAAAIASTLYINSAMVKGISPSQIASVNMFNFFITLLVGLVAFLIAYNVALKRKK